jgi:hypothetical protein
MASRFYQLPLLHQETFAQIMTVKQCKQDEAMDSTLIDRSESACPSSLTGWTVNADEICSRMPTNCVTRTSRSPSSEFF